LLSIIIIDFAYKFFIKELDEETKKIEQKKRKIEDLEITKTTLTNLTINDLDTQITNENFSFWYNAIDHNTLKISENLYMLLLRLMNELSNHSFNSEKLDDFLKKL
jgi:hypothetical protein